MRCPACDAEVADDAPRCTSCGLRLDAEGAPEGEVSPTPFLPPGYAPPPVPAGIVAPEGSPPAPPRPPVPVTGGLAAFAIVAALAVLVIVRLERGRRHGAPAARELLDPTLSAWRADDEARRHWTVKGGVLHYDGKNDDLWTRDAFGDFELSLEWRFPDPPVPADYPVFDPDGNEIPGRTETMQEAGDSGVFLRGHKKAQANLFCYPCGSGEVWQYRTDPAMPPEVRRAVTPRLRADRPPGQWNAMTIRLVGDRLTVILNGREVISQARLPGIPVRGPIGLQHEHGTIEFRAMKVRPIGPVP